jgi:hypothetical protein
LSHQKIPGCSTPQSKPNEASCLWKCQKIGNFQLFSRKKMLEYLTTAPSSIPSSSDTNLQNSYIASHTNNLHLKKNLAKIGHPYQKLLNFDRKKFKISHCASHWLLKILKLQQKIR